MMSRKPGDWNCPQCGDLQFAKNAACRKCGAENPDPLKSAKEMAAGISAGFGGAIPKQGDWFCPSCGDLQFAKNTQCRKCGTPNPGGGGAATTAMGGGFPKMGLGDQNIAMKPGDWNCPSCGDHQFAKNASCRKCGAPRPAGVKGAATKPGDWFCPNCNDLQFAANEVCRKCQTPNPDLEASRAAKEQGLQSGFGGNTEKPGDWYCPSCGDLQFARNTECRKCGEANPDPGTKVLGSQQVKREGDWHCSNCGDLNFARNMECRKCGAPNFQAMAEMFGCFTGKGKGKGCKGTFGKGKVENNFSGGKSGKGVGKKSFSKGTPY